MAGLNVAALTAENCALFMWTVDWMEPKVAQWIAEEWGFTYRTRAWVWIKSRKSGFSYHVGRGYYTQSNPEDCLLFVKGSMPVADRGVLSLVYAPIREHSRKPDEQFGIIDRLYPEGNKLEMFARRRRDGWDAFGNEVEGSIEIEQSDSA